LSGPDSPVEVTPAAPEEKPALANLFQLYTHDFSEFWAGEEEGELGEDGLFAPYTYLDTYWSDPDRIPLLVRVGGRLAGFALVNRHAHSGLKVDRNVAEFFIARKYRRGGIGTTVARTLFQRYPGLWEAAVARANSGALAFWRNAVCHCPGLVSCDELDRRTDEWDGPILRFRVEPPKEASPE
jgi:predicted acetyltransferase